VSVYDPTSPANTNAPALVAPVSHLTAEGGGGFAGATGNPKSECRNPNGQRRRLTTKTRRHKAGGGIHRRGAEKTVFGAEEGEPPGKKVNHEDTKVQSGGRLHRRGAEYAETFQLAVGGEPPRSTTKS